MFRRFTTKCKPKNILADIALNNSVTFGAISTGLAPLLFYVDSNLLGMLTGMTTTLSYVSYEKYKSFTK